MTPARAAEALRALDALLAEDPGGRGIARFRPHDALGGAARALREARAVAITTGFPRGDVGETDGPPGAFALGQALAALGARVVHLTDARCAPLLVALGAAPLEVADPAPGDRRAAEALLARLDVTHLVSIERPGRAADGTYRNMRGLDISTRTAALDEPFLLALEPGPWRRTTVCVGDGGNEVGMGNVRAGVVDAVAHGEAIASVVGADHLVVAGVSNWGAYGLIAALSLLTGRDLLPAPDDARAHVGAIVAAGAVDGVTGLPAPTVDGLPLERTLDLLAAMRRVLRATSGDRPGAPA
ncbi:MAG: DUF4392 domain-containing protein [Planctomycetes bacterium]|nr:DUF4392 domain-containing protein [Planctomycetota bacterium]